MTRADAKAAAIAEAKRSGLVLALVREGPHADEFADRDTDDQSYGFCPASAVRMLYKYGEKLKEIKP